MPSKNIDVWPKIPKIGHPFIINLLHINDQFPQLVLSTSLEETILYGKTIHMHAGRLQHIQGEGLGKVYILVKVPYECITGNIARGCGREPIKHEALSAWMLHGLLLASKCGLFFNAEMVELACTCMLDAAYADHSQIHMTFADARRRTCSHDNIIMMHLARGWK